jgi:hypothetical protein
MTLTNRKRQLGNWFRKYITRTHHDQDSVGLYTP